MNLELQPLIALVALQFALYAGGWLLAAALVPRQRRPALHWAGFMLVLGLGFWLAGQRGEPRTWYAYAGSSMAFLASFVMLWRGLESFVGARHRNVEQLAWLGLVLAALLAVGPGADQASARVLLTYGAGALIMARLLMTVQPVMRSQFTALATHLCALPAYLVLTIMAGRALQQAAAWEQPLEMHLANGRNLSFVFGYLVGAALFNISFVSLVMLRTVRWLQELSMQDALTGLKNRRALQEALEREWQRLRRSGQPFAVVVLDLDHFKRVNDQHGHEAGDVVLVHTAEQLRSVARASDVVARAGGEEFVVVMSGVDAEGAQVAAQRLLHRLRETPPPLREVRLVVTASAGVAEARQDDSEPGDVLRRADRALYRAKAEGRDRVVTLQAA